MFRKIGDALRRFMIGRYGSDQLGRWLLGAAIVLIVLGMIGNRTGSAVLAGLGREVTVLGPPELIDRIRAQGYGFVTLQSLTG